MKYTVDYFIKKFEAIPSSKIIENSVGKDNGKGCALGWCAEGAPGSSCYGTPECRALIKLFLPVIDSVTFPGNLSGWGIADVNNGNNPKYQQPTPKQRILAALYDIRKIQRVEKVIKEQYPELSTTTVEDLISEKVL